MFNIQPRSSSSSPSSLLEHELYVFSDHDHHGHHGHDDDGHGHDDDLGHHDDDDGWESCHHCWIILSRFSEPIMFAHLPTPATSLSSDHHDHYTHHGHWSS